MEVTTSRFFLGTSYVLALLNPRDTHHNKAKELFFKLRTAQEIWTTEAILIEVGNSLASTNRSAAVNIINSCYVTANLKVISVDNALFRQAVEFYHTHKDKQWGLTDCISFIVMQYHGLTEAFTTDEHFQQVGFKALLR
ncbi:MAG: PIN domain-containing protein [Candidatus Brocadiaceae bacterium]|uniref:type II toxin-antitoxin system VapC family toxin n=1 Tax=Candidatus Wunengus sp. YC61 TaxID=3367698 RepID=UPI002728C8E7|nr:PIN domain-containing protein [Candidatus Brocadiaceae bacterium]